MLEVQLGRRVQEHLKRDAIHMAVAPVVASCELKPGEHIKFVEGSTTNVEPTSPLNGIGIVDPFWHRNIEPGDRFYMLLYPYTITSLRHEWSHPAFGDVVEVPDAPEDSRTWLMRYAADNGLTYDEMLRATLEWLRTRNGYTIYGMPSITQGIEPEFWDHAEKVLGRRIPRDSREDFFSCSC